MTRSALADDAVAIRQARVRGVSEGVLRRQLALVPTPRLRRFVFIRRVTIRAGPDQLGRAMEEALTRLAGHERSEVLTFPDLPALVVACARAALAGGLHAWHWRTLGLPRLAGAGEAVAALLAAHPREAGSAVAALAAHGLLDRVWQDMPAVAAGQLTAALVQDAGFPMPAWPLDQLPSPLDVPVAVAPLLTRAAWFWTPALARMPLHAEAVRTAAVLSLLRWSPGSLRATDDGPVWPALLAHIAGRSAEISPVAPPAERDDAVPIDSAHPTAKYERAGANQALLPEARQIAVPDAAPTVADPPLADSPLADPPTAPVPHGEAITTGWGGVLFLINALRRLDVQDVLDAEGPAAPTGWRLLHDLAVALGLPEDEPMALFLAAQDLETTVAPALLANLLKRIEALYRPDGPWPLPLAQLARLRATETHLDLDLATAEVDLALRLSGLDLNPGWVPWLGRVVAFHYDAIPTRHRRSR
jgi:hypothetical protein